MAKKIRVLFINPHRCIGCGVCVQSCFNDVLRMRRGKAAIVYPDDCSQCFACEIDCPRDAVVIGLSDDEYGRPPLVIAPTCAVN